MPNYTVPFEERDSTVAHLRRQGFRVVTTTDNRDGTWTVTALGKAVETR